MPQNIGRISKGVFTGNYLTTLMIPEGATSIGEIAFAHNKLKDVIIEEGPVAIHKKAFQGNYLSNVILPKGVREMGVSAFEHNAVEKVTFPEDVIRIRGKAFANNFITQILFKGEVGHKTKDSFKNNGPHGYSNSLPVDEKWKGEWILTEDDNYKNWKRVK